MNHYKVIFLDIDGVLNSAQFDCYNFKHHHPYGLIDPRECHRISRFCDNTGVKLIISSSWRNGNSLNECIEDFRKDGLIRHHGIELLIPHMIGVTPYANSRHRGQEIQYFFDVMDDHINNIGKYKKYWKIHNETFIIDNYCIVDDDNDMLDHQKKYFVQTNPWTGLTRKNYREIRKILKLTI